MIRRNGSQSWTNVHATETAQLDDIIDIDNSAAGVQPTGFALLNQVAEEVDALVQQARQRGTRLRALGAGWALTDIAVTDGWLLNTKLLNGCFDLSSRYFEPSYPEAQRPYVVLAQCGISVGELNIHLEVTATAGFRRALKTSGIGAGQTIAGAVSGNTHGAAVNFGAIPDYVVGLQLVTGSGESLWIERASHPVLNDEFVGKLGARRIRDDDVFDAAVVSFGAFGVITALALEADPLYQLRFPPVRETSHAAIRHRLDHFDSDDPPGLYHYEFVFDPYDDGRAMEALATRVAFEPGHPAPEPVWLVRSDRGFALGDQAGPALLRLPLVGPGAKTALQYRQYRKRAILGDVQATPGQLFTATISYFEGFTESALGVSITDAARTMEICTGVVQQMRLPAMSQVRVVHPSRALLGFTHHHPKTVVFEFGLAHDATFAAFEDRLTTELAAADIAYTLHWSKNAGIDPQRLRAMYGDDRIGRWRAARARVFDGDPARMAVFDNEHLRRAGLTGILTPDHPTPT